MKLTKFVSLLAKIDDAIDAQDYELALRLLLANFDHFENSALLRERVALVSASNGRKKAAVAVWERVARHWANTGHPARSLAAIKQMQALRPDAAALLDHFTALYNIQSPYLDEQVRLPEVATPTGDIDLEPRSTGGGADKLLDRAVARAADTDTLADEPDEHLPALPLLSLLPPEALRRVLDYLEYDTFPEAQLVLEDGQICEGLIWTVTSDFTIEEHDPNLRLPSGALLGVNSFGRSATTVRHNVFSRKNSEVLRLPKGAIEALDAELGDFHNRLATLRRHALTEGLLERHPLFAGLDTDQRQTLIGRFTGLRIHKRDTLVDQGGPSPGIFLVLDGEVDVVRAEDGWEITINTLSAGDIFGEVGVVSEGMAPASIVMSMAGHLLFLSRDDFGSVAKEYPSVAKYAVNLANERMKEIEETLSARDLAEVD